MIAKEAREIGLRGEAETAGDAGERFIGCLDLAKRLLHSQRVPVDVRRQVHLFPEQVEEMWPRKPHATGHLIQRYAAAHMRLHEGYRLADSVVAPRGSGCCRSRCRLRRADAFEQTVDHAFDLIGGEFVGFGDVEQHRGLGAQRLPDTDNRSAEQCLISPFAHACRGPFGLQVKGEEGTWPVTGEMMAVRLQRVDANGIDRAGPDFGASNNHASRIAVQPDYDMRLWMRMGDEVAGGV